MSLSIYRPLQAYFNVKTLASLIFEPFIPVRFGVTRHKTTIIRKHPRITALYPPMLALTARSHGPFHLGTCMCDNKNVYFIHNVDRATNVEEITTGIENTDKDINTTENEGSAVHLHLVHIHPGGCPGFFPLPAGLLMLMG